MPIDETLLVTAKYTTPLGKALSRQSSALTIKDTSHNVIVITISKDWKTSAASSQYGSLYIKPTLNIYDEITARGGFDGSKKYLFVVDSDVVLVGDNVNVGAIHGDSRVPAGIDIRVDLWGLALGRGGYGADWSNEDCVSNKRIINGGQGGPGITSVRPLNVNVYGGLAAGGGGGGNSAYYWNDDAYSTTSQNEWWYVGPKCPIDSGAGAPFGFRDEPYVVGGAVNIMAHQNKAQLYDVDDAPSNILQVIPDNDNLYGFKYVNYRLNPRAAKVTAYADSGYGTIQDTDITLANPNAWFTRNSDYFVQIDYYRTWAPAIRHNNPNEIKLKRVYLNDLNRYGTSQGASVPAVGYAGLFKGATGAVVGRNQVSTGNWTSSFLCSSQSFIDARKEQLRGSKGGDVGRAGQNGPTPMAITSHTQPSGFESMDGIQGYNRKVGTDNANTVQLIGAGTGGAKGPEISGPITVTRQNNGAIGGDEVISKYDPNGNYDAIARLGNPALTFVGRYYTSA